MSPSDDKKKDRDVNPYNESDFYPHNQPEKNDPCVAFAEYCCVCGERRQKFDDVMTLNCGHVHHRICLRVWIEERKNEKKPIVCPTPKCNTSMNDNRIVALRNNILSLVASSSSYSAGNLLSIFAGTSFSTDSRELLVYWVDENRMFYVPLLNAKTRVAEVKALLYENILTSIKMNESCLSSDLSNFLINEIQMITKKQNYKLSQFEDLKSDIEKRYYEAMRKLDEWLAVEQKHIELKQQTDTHLALEKLRTEYEEKKAHLLKDLATEKVELQKNLSSSNDKDQKDDRQPPPELSQAFRLYDGHQYSDVLADTAFVDNLCALKKTIRLRTPSLFQLIVRLLPIATSSVSSKVSSFCLQVSPLTSVQELKHLIVSHTSCPLAALHLILVGKPLSDDRHLLRRYDIKNNAEVTVTVRLQGGMFADPFRFNPEHIIVSPWNPERNWLTVKHGLNIEGTCKLNPRCRAHNRIVYIPMEDNRFELGQVEDTLLCPAALNANRPEIKCNCYVQPSSCGFRRCWWYMEGRKVSNHDLEPDDLLVRRRPTRAENDFDRIPSEGGLTQWQQLRVKATFEDPTRICARCMEPLDEGHRGSVITLPCGDRMHDRCLEIYQRIESECPAPYCQEFMLPYNGRKPALPSSLHNIDGIRAVAVDPCVEEQVDGTCYAHAIATCVIASKLRITGRRIESFSRLVFEIIRDYNGGYEGNFVDRMLRIVQPKHRFQFSLVNSVDDVVSVLKLGRPVLAVFGPHDNDDFWRRLKQRARQPPHLVNRADVNGLLGNSHAVVITGYNEQTNPPYLVVKNSWGIPFGDDGYFKTTMDFPFHSMYQVYIVDPNLTNRERRYFELSRENPMCVTELIVGSSEDNVIDFVTFNGVTYGTSRNTPGARTVSRWFNNFCSVFIVRLKTQSRADNANVLQFVEVYFSNRDMISIGQTRNGPVSDLRNPDGLCIRLPLRTTNYQGRNIVSSLDA